MMRLAHVSSVAEDGLTDEHAAAALRIARCRRPGQRSGDPQERELGHAADRAIRLPSQRRVEEVLGDRRRLPGKVRLNETLTGFHVHGDLHLVERLLFELGPLRTEPIGARPLRSAEPGRRDLDAVDSDVELVDFGREVLEPVVCAVLFRTRLNQVIAVGRKEIMKRNPTAGAERHLIAPRAPTLRSVGSKNVSGVGMPRGRVSAIWLIFAAALR